jgi:diacylglycerol kinase
MVWTVNDKDENKLQTTEIDTSVLGTAKIAPDRYGDTSNTSVWQRMKYAVAGLLHLLVHHRSFTYIVVTTVAVYGVAWWLRLDGLRIAVLTVVLGQLWLAEIVNTALEALTDLTTKGEIRSLAKVTKDVAASATFISSGVLLIICGILLLPPILARF